MANINTKYYSDVNSAVETRTISDIYWWHHSAKESIVFKAYKKTK